MKCTNCPTLISRKSVTGLCRTCAARRRNKIYIKRIKSEGKCIDCKEKINPMIIYPNGLKGIKLIKFPIRCYNCRIKQIKRAKQYKHLKSKTNLNNNG